MLYSLKCVQSDVVMMKLPGCFKFLDEVKQIHTFVFISSKIVWQEDKIFNTTVHDQKA